MTTKNIYNVTTIKSKDLRIICYPLVNDDSIAKIAWFPFLEIWNQDGVISLRTNTSGISLNIECYKIWFHNTTELGNCIKTYYNFLKFRVLENVLGSIEGGRNFKTVSLTNHLTSQNASSKQKLTTKV